MQKIFVTSSGTGIGKTLVTCALAKALKNNKKKTFAMKPIISGFSLNVVPNDVFNICESLGINYISEREKVNFLQYKLPMSPDMAARIGKEKEVNFKQLLSFCDSAPKRTEYNIIETVGGLMVPVNSKKLSIDWVKNSADRVVLVVGSYLGSLSHSLSAYKLLQDIGKKPCLVVVTQNLSLSDHLYIPLKETIKSLENFISSPILAVENLKGDDKHKISKLSRKFNGAIIKHITR